MVDYSAYQRLKVERDGEILRITIDRADRDNLVDGALHTEMSRIWADVRADLDAKVIVLRGAGDAWFCNTADPEWAAAFDARMYRQVAHEGRWGFGDMAGVQQPIVAAMNGDACNFGSTLLAMCDIIVAADHARVWDHHNILYGIASGDGGALAYPLSMGLNRAKAMMLLGEKLPARELVELGVAYRAVPLAELDATVTAIAQKLCEQPAEALWWTKMLLNRPLKDAVTRDLDMGVLAEAYTSLLKPSSEKRRS
ncbi:MAG: enoyl-CoA hydratase/isomerase family protein [Sphingomonadales bacterium]|nr:MAG: enoyl-CoA hydratase/isomerase family protein [Sphingomonadales bacterium]